MRDFIARIQMWVLRLVLPSRGRHAGRAPAGNAVPSRPSAPVPGWPESPAGTHDTSEFDPVTWCDEPLVRSFVLAEEERRAAERCRRQEEAEEKLLRAHRNAALLAAEEGREYPELLYLRPDTPITPVTWTGTQESAGVWS
ncbi:hypothetical protein AF335_05005 [Streptomyces eurocidicus]|uniref:Uncharacterized protein n=1 Tax=Streptomyces eurocidicus TaxID=66423 RepID=A0A2N8NZ45_STREU|nr:hypothetical protein AF335_05005 [Streptomyces eurocidicus]